MPRTAFLGLGHYVPTKVVTNDDLAQMFDTSDEWIQQRTGIKERRFIEHSGIGPADLAVPGGQDGVRERQHPSRPTSTRSSSPRFRPTSRSPVRAVSSKRNSVSPVFPALDIRNQCSGFLYGLQIADAWIRCGMYKRVALVGGEVHSTGIDLTDEGRDVAVLFGDGAACAILGPTEEEGVIDVEVHADGRGAKELWIESPTSAHMPRITHCRSILDHRSARQLPGRYG